jgi:hypothetical protein
VISVAATDWNGNLTYYSNYGSAVDLSAPGGSMSYANDPGGILSTLNTGTQEPGADAYAYYQGTSMAAPAVTGVISLLYSLNPALTPCQVLAILQSTATHFPTSSVCSTGNHCGAGIVNAGAAVQSLVPKKTDTQTRIIYDTPDPSTPGQAVTVSFSVIPTQGAGTPTGSVIVSDGTRSCSAPVAYGQCAIIFTSAGAKSLVATYPGDVNFNGSTSAVEPHTVNALTAPPVSFGKTSPGNNAANLPKTLTLWWSASFGADSYEFCLDTINDSACNSGWTNIGANTSVTLSGLNYATTYSWQVRAVNAIGTTLADGNTWWTFTTQAAPLPLPNAFTKNSPGSGIGNQPTSLTLSWQSTSPVTDYEVCYNTTLICANWTNVGLATSIQVSGLSYSKEYYWQVRAWNGTLGPVYADGGSWWSFTIQPITTFIPMIIR